MQLGCRLLSVFLICLVGWPALAEPANDLLQLLRPMDNISAHFEQQTFDASGTQLQKQSGQFVVQKSGQFLWLVNPPYEQQIVSNGKILHLYDPDLEQVTVRNLDKKSQVIPLLLFSADAAVIMQKYRITRDTNNNPGSYFLLEPLEKGHLFDSLLINFQGQVPVFLEIRDSLKQVTRVTFSRVVCNQQVDQARFNFVAPAGVDVIDERK